VLLDIGKRRRLMECSTTQGVLTILALDQRNSLKKSMRPKNPEKVSYRELVGFKHHIISKLAPQASAVLLDPEYGVAQNITQHAIPGTTGVIVALEESGYYGDPHARKSAILDGWTIEKAIKIGSTGVKLLIYYHPRSKFAGQQRDLVAEVAGKCSTLGTPFFLEPLLHSIDPEKPKLSPDERRELMVTMVEELSVLGVDVMKLEFPIDVQSQPEETIHFDACSEITKASKVPWVLLSAGVDFDVYLRQVIVACSAGASGIMAGRAIWKEAIGLNYSGRELFLNDIAIPRLMKLRSIVDGLAKTWDSYYQSNTISEGWYLNYLQ